MSRYGTRAGGGGEGLILEWVDTPRPCQANHEMKLLIIISSKPNSGTACHENQSKGGTPLPQGEIWRGAGKNQWGLQRFRKGDCGRSAGAPQCLT